MTTALAEHTTTFKGFDFEKPVLDLEEELRELERAGSEDPSLDSTAQKDRLLKRLDEVRREVYGTLLPWQRVQMARHPRRPYTLDYIEHLFTGFIELHGDRHYSDDKAIVGGLAYLEGRPVVVMGHQKGRTLQDSMARNFGMPHPEGYRKALRLMKLADKFRVPIVTFIDTAGAYPGIGAEERGQATAIAENLREMSQFNVPILTCVIGEGGSGGALALGVADRILMLENAYYSVISPEGCASILYHDASKAQEAARALKITAVDLKELGVIDEMIPEPLGGAHRDVDVVMATVKGTLLRHLAEVRAIPSKDLLNKRYEKFRVIGQFSTTDKARVAPVRTKKSPSPKKRSKT
ncbi:MAG: acetyl-CoA carboxylase carboxyltransferase subunit alpha [Elusimicrobia bacterium]|jgi:acetyl-CoA carboxylase carboxyl transferase subunit alpha|nr:acetyl-CoA carboxylase carboxyltransferase subunit alpha [Elusimicrobiota bacterium]